MIDEHNIKDLKVLFYQRKYLYKSCIFGPELNSPYIWMNYLPFNVSILVLVYPKPPLPYGLPKVDKDDIPMRLIVSSIGSAT